MSVSITGELSRRWNGEGGLQAISRPLQQGGFLSFLWPSGCGKSTFLGLVSGLQQPQEGVFKLFAPPRRLHRGPLTAECWTRKARRRSAGLRVAQGCSCIVLRESSDLISS